MIEVLIYVFEALFAMGSVAIVINEIRSIAKYRASAPNILERMPVKSTVRAHKS